MTYVISDIHGHSDTYFKMLKAISFSKDDTLIVLGDVCDRGNDPATIYLDLMQRKNAICLKGNHELMAESVLPYMYSLKAKPSRSIYKANYNRWIDNGGEATMLSFYQYSDSTRLKILEYIQNMPYYLELCIGDKSFILTHGGIDNYMEGKPLNEYTPQELVWARPDYDTPLWDDKSKFLIVGHTPTMTFRKDRPPLIYRGKGNIIDIDCGEAYRNYGGRLGCLCLETMEEFYA